MSTSSSIPPNTLTLRRHTTRLPTFLYPLSFCPSVPSPLRHPLKFLHHPLTLYTLGIISAILAGACLPASGIVYGWWTNGVTGSGNPEDKLERSRQAGWIMTVVGVAAFFLSWMFLWCFSTASDALTLSLRRTYITSILAQDPSFFDTHGPGEVASRAGKDISTIRSAFGEKMGYVFWSAGTLLASIIPSFILAARLSGILIGIIPFTLLIILISSYLIHTSSTPISALEGRSSSLIEQILSSIRIAQTFSMEPHLVSKLDSRFLSKLEKLGKPRALARAFEQAGVYFSLFLTFSLGFWASGIEVVAGVEVGYAMTVFWNLVNALFALANVLPHIASLADAGVALTTLRAQIERQPFIDIRNTSGLTLPTPPGHLEPSLSSTEKPDSVDWTPDFELRNITFAYPSRPAVKSLDDISLRIESGKMTAFVGHSGSGKSTTVGLLLREYDPETGNVLNPADVGVEGVDETDTEIVDGEMVIKGEKDQVSTRKQGPGSKLRAMFGVRESRPDVEKPSDEDISNRTRVQGGGTVMFAGRDIREYNLEWYRQQISVVSQAPQLFSTSIFGNVAAGLTGTAFEFDPDRDVEDSSDEQIRERLGIIRELVVEALTKAQAWEFVVKLPEGMDTLITGGRAQLLSGGQRQRVALARALVRKPAVLLLDEATSALDTASEEKIRQMLEIEQKERGMTLVVIAHRMSTVVSADKIFVMHGGKVVDEGTYDELVEDGRKDQTFKNMVLANQEQQRADKEDTVDEKVADEKNALDALSDDQSGIFSASSTVGIMPEGTGRSTPPVLSRFRSNSTARRPDVHMLYSGRGSNYGRMDHAVDGPGGIAGTVNPPTTHDDQLSRSDTISVQNEKHTGEVSERPDPLKPRRYRKGTLLKKYWHIMANRKMFFLFGVACSIAAGAGWPIEGWLVGEGVDDLSIEGDNAAVRSGANHWAFWFLILALADFAVLIANGVAFELTSERVVRNLKRDGMAALLKQEVGFFESSEESDSGALTSAISSKPTDITGAAGLILSQIIVAIVNLIGSMILGFVLSWKIAIVALPPVLLTFFSGWLNVAMLDKYETNNSGPASRSASFLSETVDVIRTVTNLNYQRSALRTFDKFNLLNKRTSFYLNLGAIGFSISQAMIILLQALLFYWGGKLVAEEGLSTVALYASFEAIIIAAFASSRLLLFVGDVGRAFSGMAVMQSWFDRQPLIASVVPEALNEKQGHELGDIVLSNIELRYPRRPEHPALRNVSLTIKAGQTHAFCGSSGSGKSSLLALLLRFYEPCKGKVTYGGRDSRSIPLNDLRSRCAYVSQDPQLFEGTIRWNLSLGASDPEQLSQEALEEACEQACILDFIRGLKDGFETEIGMKGAALSGGQRQRLCIARALIRKPEILFLDEATSALDATSELQVNKALANASKGRTTITIAHRLSTIRQADVIHVIEDGRVKEEGSHDELIKAKGRYVELVQAQM